MGNEGSRGKKAAEADRYGQVYLQLNQDTFNPGDTVNGTIYVNLKSVYPGDKLCLKVKGKEFTKWVDKEARQRTGADGQPETYYVDVLRQGELDHIRNVVDVYDWAYGSNLPPGQFTFPIQFTVPKGIPSSFFLRRGTVVAEIRYYIEAYLKPDFNNVPKIKHKRDVIIKETLNQQVQTKEVSMNKEITTCCCFGQGNVSMKTYFEKNAYHPGETARIVTEVDNSQCKLDVTSINFSLTQTVTLKADNRQRAFTFTIRSAGLGSIPAGQSFVGQNRKEAQLELPPPIEGNAKAFKGENAVQEYSIDPSMAISPTTNGNLVKSNFDLRVFCGMDACCMCDGLPGTSLPINVYSLAQQKIVDPTPPAGWNPTPMPSANLTITVNVGGTQIQINQGGAPTQQPGGMVNNQMPQQNMNQPQGGFNNQPQMNTSTPGYNQPPQQNFNNSQPQQNNFNNQPPQNNQPNYNNNQGPQNNYNNNQGPQNNYNNNQGPQNNQPNYNNQGPQNNYNNQPQQNNNYNNNQGPQNNYNNNQGPQNNYNNNQGPQNNYNNGPHDNYNNQNNYNNQGPQNNYNNNQPNYNNQGPQNNYNNNQGNYNNQQQYPQNNYQGQSQPQNVNPHQVNVGQR